MSDFDVVIVGGGLAGTAAAAVAQNGLRVLHLAPKAGPDARTSALMLPSVEILKRFGLVLNPGKIGTPLRQIRIIDATEQLVRAPETLFDAKEAGFPAFGWNFPNSALHTAFSDALDAHAGLERWDTSVTDIKPGVTGHRLMLSDGRNVETRLIVGADGKRSMVRAYAGVATKEIRHKSAALVADLALERAVGQTSIEFHYKGGPFTLVPAGGNKVNLVWIDRPDVLAAAKEKPHDELCDLLSRKAQRLFGAVEVTTRPVIFPLSSLFVTRAGRKGVVLVGEAAHAFPPIGAQGLNLGLRDVADLADSLGTADTRDATWAELASRAYADKRARDLAQTGVMVDTLYASLVSGYLPAQAMRAAGLWALRGLPFLRKQAFAAGMGAR